MSMFNYECDEIKAIIEDVSPNYPQLTTYTKEWLYFHKYGYIPGIPVDLEYQAVEGAGFQTVNNAIPFNYKRAILKGNTLVNIAPPNKTITLTGGSTSWKTYGSLPYKLTAGTKYILYIDITENTVNDEAVQMLLRQIETGGGTQYVDLRGISKTGYTTFTVANNRTDVDSISFFIGNTATTGNFVLNNLRIFKYQEDMENWDVPYFEGMQFVKMPVLTTSNEDGTKTNILTVNDLVELRSNGDVYDELNLLTGLLTQRIDENNEVLPQEVVKIVNLTDKLPKPYDGVNHYETYSDTIPPIMFLEVPVVSTGNKTLLDIQNQD